jgi:CheY-like chemotaxis protein
LHPKRAKLLTGALSFFQYARYLGKAKLDLAAAVPVVADRSMSSIPRAIADSANSGEPSDVGIYLLKYNTIFIQITEILGILTRRKEPMSENPSPNEDDFQTWLCTFAGELCELDIGSRRTIYTVAWTNGFCEHSKRAHLSAARSESQPTGEPQTAQAARTILVVDDSPVNNEILMAVLENEGFNVICASDGIKGLALLQKNESIDAVVLDLLMPELDGYRVCAQIRALQPALPIIAYSAAYSSFDDQLEIMAKGATKFVRKSDYETLLKTLREILNV